MLSILAGLLVFAALAVLVLNALDGDETERAKSTRLAVLVWMVYFVHADTVAIAAYSDIARIGVPRVAGFLVGGIVGLGGLGLLVWATRTLVRDGAFDGIEPTRLVTAGPYRLMRHPQNTGWAMVLLGVALAGRSLVALGLVALFALFAARMARAETRRLHARFGSAFDSWASRTQALPRPGQLS